MPFRIEIALAQNYIIFYAFEDSEIYVSQRNLNIFRNANVYKYIFMQYVITEFR